MPYLPTPAKTGAHDAHGIADALRSKPHTLPRVDDRQEALAELTVPVAAEWAGAGAAPPTAPGP